MSGTEVKGDEVVISAKHSALVARSQATGGAHPELPAQISIGSQSPVSVHLGPG
jgi:hypothetical protein